AGMDDEQALLAGLGRQHLVAEGLLLGHLAGVAGVQVGGLVAHGAPTVPTSASFVKTPWSLLRRGFHRRRSMASWNRAPISLRAAGLCSSMKRCTSGSPR